MYASDRDYEAWAEGVGRLLTRFGELTVPLLALEGLPGIPYPSPLAVEGAWGRWAFPVPYASNDHPGDWISWRLLRRPRPFRLLPRLVLEMGRDCLRLHFPPGHLQPDGGLRLDLLARHCLFPPWVLWGSLEGLRVLLDRLQEVPPPSSATPEAFLAYFRALTGEVHQEAVGDEEAKRLLEEFILAQRLKGL